MKQTKNNFKTLKANNTLVQKIIRRYLRYRINSEKLRIQNIERYTKFTSNILGDRVLSIVDSASFLYMYKEIFEQEIYKFTAKSDKPLIIDGGANIGLSLIYYKQIYPEAKIIGFEPDPNVFECLTENIENSKLNDVHIFRQALWSKVSTLEFMNEGADGGRVVETDSGMTTYKVESIRLREFLDQPVDFLKLDIEGAETEVIRDCQDLLHNVENIFIEYHSFANQRQTFNTLLEILYKNDFRLHIHTPMPSPQPFIERKLNLGMDMQVNIFAFRD